MLYYVELDENKEFLEIKQSKSIDSLRKELRMTWNTINNYINSREDYDKRYLPCGSRVPLMSRSKKLYIISTVEGYLETQNYSYMSKEVIKELKYRQSFKNGYEGAWE